MLWCCALAGFALATNYVLALALLFTAGFFELAFNSMAQTLVQLRAPVEMRGRVIGLFNMASLGLRAFSGISVGVVGSLIGVHWSLALAASAMLVVACGLLALPSR
jgi:MFS family permease